MLIVIFLLCVPTVALLLAVERTDNGTIIVSQSIVVSRGKTTNISSNVIIRNNRKPTVYSAENASATSTPQKRTTASARAVLMAFTRKTTAKPAYRTWVETSKTQARQKTEPFETTVESFLDVFMKTATSVSESSKGTYTSLRVKPRTSSNSKFMAGIARLFQKRTSKAPRRPITAPLLAVEMLRDAFQIDHGWVHRKRFRRSIFDITEVSNTTEPLVPDLDKDTRMVLLLMIALLLLALSSVMSYRPIIDNPYCIRLNPAGPVLYERVPTSDCWDTASFYCRNMEPRDKRFIYLVHTKILVSRMVRRFKTHLSQNSVGAVPGMSENSLLTECTNSHGHPSAQSESGTLHSQLCPK